MCVCVCVYPLFFFLLFGLRFVTRTNRPAHTEPTIIQEGEFWAHTKRMHDFLRRDDHFNMRFILCCVCMGICTGIKKWEVPVWRQAPLGRKNVGLLHFCSKCLKFKYFRMWWFFTHRKSCEVQNITSLICSRSTWFLTFKWILTEKKTKMERENSCNQPHMAQE